MNAPGLLIELLAKHWRDSQPFQLLIVAPRNDVALLRTSLPRFPNIEVSVRSESDFFAPFSRFYLLPAGTGSRWSSCRCRRSWASAAS